MKQRILVAVAFLSLAGAVSAGLNFGVETSYDQRYYRSSGLTSFEVRYGGEIELSPDRKRIVSMAPDAFLEIERRIFLTTRRLRASATAGGGVEIHFWVGERRGSDAEAREFLQRFLPEAIRETAVGARSEARRLLKAGNPVAVIEAARDRESERAREAYFDVVLEAGGLNAAQGAEIVRLAPREISGSARLMRLLTHLARTLPADDTLTADVARACAEISSSRVHADALLSVADARGVPAAAAREFSRSASRIDSSLEKARAIEGLAPLCEGPASVGELADAAATIESSAERRRALTALVSHSGLDQRALSRIILAGEGINSSAEKASFLESAAASSVRLDSSMVAAYLKCAGTIGSSSEKRRAAVALLRRGDLDPSATLAVSDFAEHQIESRSERLAVLNQIGQR